MAAPLPLIIVAALIAGVGLELYGVFWETTLQEHIPEEKLSRVSSYDVLGSFALIPVGVAFMGPIAHWIGVENTLIGAAVVVVLATITVIAVADVRNLRRVEQPVLLPTKPSVEAPRFLAPSPAAGSPVPPA